MPGFITHYICGQAVLNTVGSDTQKMIRPYQQFYNIGTQGPDIFFYYLPGLLKKNTRDIGTQMHKHHFGTFIAHMIDYMMQDNLSEDARSLMLAYISGFLTHYALDATAHPYVYSKTGMRQKGDKAKAIKYSVNHRKFETAIDVLMLELMSSKKPSDYKLWELIRVDHDPALVVSAAMSSSISQAYERNINPKEIYKAMRYMVRLTKILQSGKGRRKRLMELIENLTIGEHLFSSIIHMQQVSDGVDYMNIKKSPWNLPVSVTGLVKSEEKTDSFVELYHNSIQQSVHMIDTLWRCMAGEISRDKLALTLGDRSLATGFSPEPAIAIV